MGCGCGRSVRRNIRRPVARARTLQSSRISALQIQALSILPERSPGGMSQERRFIERKRRAAIARRILGK